MKLTITWIGQPKTIETKYGPKQKNSLRATEYGENYLGYWMGSNTQWRVGDVVDVEAVTPRDYNGKTYHDIFMSKLQKTTPNIETMALSHKIDQLSSQLRSIIDHLSGKNRFDLTSAGTKVPDFSEVDDGLDQINADEINPEDIPF